MFHYLIDAPQSVIINGVNINRANIGSTSIMHCTAQALPAPKFVWQKGGQPYNGPADVGNGTLIFRDVKTEDSGIYRCTASNMLGEAHFERSFTVYGTY